MRITGQRAKNLLNCPTKFSPNICAIRSSLSTGVAGNEMSMETNVSRAGWSIFCLYRCQNCPWPIYRSGFNGVRPIWSHLFLDGKRRAPWPRTLCEDVENRVLGAAYHATPIWDELISEFDREFLTLLGIEAS